ncbi:uncharacterized protein LOC126835683 [Adelges cooleyi]|uniref:uncharacterized protein LOC126835683 n=1 Tax=Adelges cooleyi TaxID=133065 RepID=UPI00217FB108|nr:uncharacterized protein LOC126835683 [Adelges cooleyi]XP_050424385.1 uncharacterized protein LOC126835683 [Adelges cooleyi]
MNTKDRQEARRRRILENSETRLKKITDLSTSENSFNSLIDPIDKEQESILWLPETSITECNQIHESNKNIEEKVFNYKLTNSKSESYFTAYKYYEINFSKSSALNMVLSQIVLALLYYDLGFIFGNSAVLPFTISIIPELLNFKEDHDNFYVFGLLLLGISQEVAQQVSKSFKLASFVAKRFCVYVFCFTISYVIFRDSKRINDI